MITGKLLAAAGAFGAPAGLATWLVVQAMGPSAGVAPAAAAASRPAEPGIEWFWAINGPVSADAGGDFAIDAEGNVFLAGSHGGLDIDHDGNVDLASGATAYKGARNPLFMKLGSDGPGQPMKIRWARSPATPADRSDTRIAVDGRGGAFVTGAFMESLSFEGGPRLAGAGGNDAYLARYDADGSVRWARVVGGPDGGDAIYGLASDGDANAYVLATGTGSFPLDGGGAFEAPDRRAAALISYSPEGAVRWVRVFGAGTPFAFGIAVAPSGQVFVTGELEGEADFDGDGRADLPAPRDRDGFVARFNREGRLLGAWTTPTPGSPRFGPDGDLFMAGVMGGPMDQRYGPPDFDGDGKADIRLRDEGPTGSWLARYSPEGELRWVRSSALERPSDFEVRSDIVILAGSYKGVRDLDEDGKPEIRRDVVDSKLETDMAVLIVSADDGKPVRTWLAPGPGNDVASGIAFLPGRRSVLVTGSLQLTADFTGDGEFGEGWIVCENLGDIFVAQYRLPERPPERPREERPREEPKREPRAPPR